MGETENRAEADRLSLLPAEDQRAVLAVYRACANNPKLTAKQRAWNQARVAAVERHLRRLNRQKKSRPLQTKH